MASPPGPGIPATRCDEAPRGRCGKWPSPVILQSQQLTDGFSKNGEDSACIALDAESRLHHQSQILCELSGAPPTLAVVPCGVRQVDLVGRLTAPKIRQPPGRRSCAKGPRARQEGGEATPTKKRATPTGQDQTLGRSGRGLSGKARHLNVPAGLRPWLAVAPVGSFGSAPKRSTGLSSRAEALQTQTASCFVAAAVKIPGGTPDRPSARAAGGKKSDQIRA